MGELFDGRPVVITGGDGALGQAVVRAFVEAGATCHLPVRGVPAAGADRVRITGPVDLTDETAVEAFYASVPRPVASVHLAGGFQAGPIGETSRADLDRMLGLNLVTAFLCCREAVKAMRRSGGGGRIVNVAARVVESPSGAMTAYSVSKGAVAALTRVLAEEVRAEGIQVNAVLPSIIDTPANRAAMPTADHTRWPRADDVARAIVWLASPANALTSGALVPVYGRG